MGVAPCWLPAGSGNQRHDFWTHATRGSVLEIASCRVRLSYRVSSIGHFSSDVTASMAVVIYPCGHSCLPTSLPKALVRPLGCLGSRVGACYVLGTVTKNSVTSSFCFFSRTPGWNEEGRAKKTDCNFPTHFRSSEDVDGKCGW